MSRSRRSVVIAGCSLVCLGGCVDLENTGFRLDGNESALPNNSSTTAAQPDEVEQFQSALDGAGLDVVEIEGQDDLIALTVQTDGDPDAEVREVALVYSAESPDLSRDLSLVITDRGLTRKRVDIKHKWAEDHASGRMSEEEYLNEIDSADAA